MKMNDHPHDKKECFEMFARLSEYLDNELDEITCRDIERHMSHCPPCQVCLATLKRTVTLCKNMQNQAVPKELSAKLKQMISEMI